MKVKEFKATLALALYLQSAEQGLDEKDLQAMWSRIGNALDYYKSVLGAVPAGIERVKIMHALIDAQKPISPVAISCSRGCFGCCRGRIVIHKDEMDLLGPPGAEGKPGFCAYLSRVGECTVYDNRPAMCRLHTVKSDPSICYQEEGDTVRIVQMLPELILSSFAELEEEDNQVEMPIRELENETRSN